MATGKRNKVLYFAEMAEVSALFGRAGCVRCGCEVVGVGTAAVPGRVGQQNFDPVPAKLGLRNCQQIIRFHQSPNSRKLTLNNSLLNPHIRYNTKYIHGRTKYNIIEPVFLFFLFFRGIC